MGSYVKLMGASCSQVWSESIHDDDSRGVTGSDRLKTLDSSQDWQDWLTSLRRLANDLLALRLRLNIRTRFSLYDTLVCEGVRVMLPSSSVLKLSSVSK